MEREYTVEDEAEMDRQIADLQEKVLAEMKKNINLSISVKQVEENLAAFHTERNKLGLSAEALRAAESRKLYQ